MKKLLSNIFRFGRNDGHAPPPIAPHVFTGPFGFHYGQTIKNIASVTDKSVFIQQLPGPLPGTYILYSAPTPHPGFLHYIIIVSPTTGLVSIKATSKYIKSDATTGIITRDQYIYLRHILSAKYGKPIPQPADIDPKSLGNDWIDRVYTGELTINSKWNVDPTKFDHLTSILLQINMTQGGGGLITLTYTYDGLDAYIDSVNSDRNAEQAKINSLL